MIHFFSFCLIFFAHSQGEKEKFNDNFTITLTQKQEEELLLTMGTSFFRSSMSLVAPFFLGDRSSLSCVVATR